jgi:hypothetical protein
MDNLYLITRLDDIRAAFIALVILAGILAITFIVIYLNYKGELVDVPKECIDNYKKEKYWCRAGKKGTRWSLIVFFISMIALCVIPTTKQGLLLFGVNETVEYCEKHPEAKQIPDKCIKALNKYLDEELSETQEN